MESLSRVSNQCVRHRVVFIVKSETPGSFLAFALEADRRVKLHSNRQVPLEGLLVVLEPHLLVVVDLVLVSD